MHLLIFFIGFSLFTEANLRTRKVFEDILEVFTRYITAGS